MRIRFVAEAVPDVTSSVLNVSVAACKMGPMNHLFDMEVHLHELLLRSSARVDTPEKVPFGDGDRTLMEPAGRLYLHSRVRQQIRMLEDNSHGRAVQPLYVPRGILYRCEIPRQDPLLRALADLAQPLGISIRTCGAAAAAATTYLPLRMGLPTRPWKATCYRPATPSSCCRTETGALGIMCASLSCVIHADASAAPPAHYHPALADGTRTSGAWSARVANAAASSGVQGCHPAVLAPQLWRAAAPL